VHTHLQGKPKSFLTKSLKGTSMSQNWTAKERFSATIAGEIPDRPPVAAWTHFVNSENGAQALAEATTQYTKTWGWDWVKINPRATYYAEAFGAQFDPSDYRDVLPRLVSPALDSTSEFGSLEPREARQTPVLAEHLEASLILREALPELPLIHTVFSPLTILFQLVGLDSFLGSWTLYGADPDSAPQHRQVVEADPSALAHALNTITETLSGFVTELLDQGIDGIFFAELGVASLVDRHVFDELARPYDLQVLEAAARGTRILHTCASNSHPEWFADYPIEVIQWDSHAEGNPPLDAEIGHIRLGGVSQQLFGTANTQLIENQTRAARELAKQQPLLLSPNCALPQETTQQNLAAFQKTATTIEEVVA
jgi:uroporphyrinogen decarboxylase